MNKILIDTDIRKRTVLHHDLDSLAGTWSAEDEKEFNAAIQIFESIDSELWE